MAGALPAGRPGPGPRRDRPAARRDRPRLPARRRGAAQGPRAVSAPAGGADGGARQLRRARGAAGVLVVGTGLIGTSVALALRRVRARRVHLVDRDDAALATGRRARSRSALAAHRRIRASWSSLCRPRAVASVIEDLPTYIPPTRYLLTSARSSLTFRQSSRVAGRSRPDSSAGTRWPGRERSGTGRARADLFEGRPWVLTPTSEASPERVAAVRALVLACGAQPVVVDAPRHDEAVALVSHVPQLVATLTAARLVDADAGRPSRWPARGSAT